MGRSAGPGRRRTLLARRWSYRRGQSLVLTGLAALVVAACASGPLYARAVEQATVRSTLSNADRTSRGIKVVTDRIVPADQLAPRGAAASLFGQPVSGGDLTGTVVLPKRGKVEVPLAYRDDVCRHLTLAAGRCVRADGEVVASAASARAVGLRLGQQLTLAYGDGTVSEPARIVGLYRPFPGKDDYWFDTQYSTPAGIVAIPSTLAEPGSTALSAFFTTSAEIAAVGARIGLADAVVPVQASVTFPLDVAHIGVDDLGALTAELRRLSRTDLTRTDEFPDSTTSAQTGLDGLLAQIDTGRRDARRSILALGVQLALLAALCFLVVVLSAADEHRPELALSRLRGQGIRRTAAVFVREIGTLSVLAVVPGALAAYGLTALACRLWLVPGVHAELGPTPVLAVAAALVVLVVIAVAVGLRVSRAPVSDLLREVPSLRTRRGLGALEVAVFVAALAGLVTTLRGGDTSTLSTLTPTFLAVLAGLVLSRLLVLVGRLAGRRALRRGRLVPALAGVGVARRSGGRLTATILCVATALVIFAGQQWSVAAANRAQRAAASTGAAVALDVTTPSMAALVRAVRRVDPDGTWATPLATIQPPNAEAVPVLAVDPRSFGAVASWGRDTVRPSQARLDSLAPTPQAPQIPIRASSLQITLASSSVRPLVVHTGTPPSAVLRVLLRFPNDASGYTDVAALPTHASGPVTLTTEVRCTDGCSIAGFDIARIIPDSVPIAVSFTVSGLRAGTATLAVGKAGDWKSTTNPLAVAGINVKDSMRAVDTAAGLRFDAIDDGNFAAMQHLDYPVGLPALLAGPLPEARDELGYVIANGLDGMPDRVVVVGTLPFAPGLGPSAIFVDLDLAIRTSGYVDALTSPAVWLRTDDPGRERRLVAALAAAGAKVEARRASATLRAQYAASAPGWSARYSIVVAALAELLGLGLLVLVLVTSRRVREHDLSAMRLAGVTTRRLLGATTIELIAIVVAGVVGGTLAGVLAARLVLHRLPIFAAPPIVPLPAAFPLQARWLAGAVALTAVVLVAAAVVLASALVRRANPERLAGSARA